MTLQLLQPNVSYKHSVSAKIHARLPSHLFPPLSFSLRPQVWVFFLCNIHLSQPEASWAFPSQSLDEPESWQFSKGNMPNVTELY